MAPVRRKSLNFCFAMTAILLLLAVSRLYACPMCSDIVERGKDALAAMRLGQGIGWSILLMLTVPFLMVGTLVGVILRAQNRKDLTHGIKN